MCYAHLTQAQRYQIERLVQANCKVTCIARKLGVHRSTVYRELNRGARSRHGYVAWYAQEAAERRARRSAANHPSKPDELWRLIRRLIRLDWSPEQANTATGVLRRVPFRSLTLDNGTEFANYRRIERALSCKVYFTDPQSPWQRGTCENTIGLVRQYIPKGSSGAHLTKPQIQRIEDKLNHRPRKCLGFKTPAEVLLNAKPPVALRT